MDGAGPRERHRGVAKLGVACRMIWLVRGSVTSLWFVGPNKRDRLKKPDRPDPRHAVRNGSWYPILFAHFPTPHGSLSPSPDQRLQIVPGPLVDLV